MEYQGVKDIYGPRDTFKEASILGIITNADIWFEAIETRKFILETYEYELTEKMYEEIREKFNEIFKMLYNYFGLIER